MKLVKEYKKEVIAEDPTAIVREMAEFTDEKKEFFVVFYLDTRQKLMSREVVHIGTLNESLIHPREIFKGAVMRSAAAIIVSHNHPSGDPEPSTEDKEVTKDLKKAGEILGIQLLDHVVVAGNKWQSLVYEGEGGSSKAEE